MTLPIKQFLNPLITAYVVHNSHALALNLGLPLGKLSLLLSNVAQKIK